MRKKKRLSWIILAQIGIILFDDVEYLKSNHFYSGRRSINKWEDPVYYKYVGNYIKFYSKNHYSFTKYIESGSPNIKNFCYIPGEIE